MHRSLIVGALTAAVIAGCGSEADDGSSGTVPAVTEPEPPVPASSEAPTASGSSTPLSATPISPVAPPGSGEAPGFPIDADLPLVTAAVDDLAGRLGIEPADVTVSLARAVTWGDSSLGCPEPGMAYLQQLVDGTLVVLEAGGRRYEYHGGDPLALCENPKPPSGA